MATPPRQRPQLRDTRYTRLRLEPLEDRRMLSLTLFVDADAAPGGDGVGWSTAFDDLQAALESASVLNADADAGNDVDAIWIAEGVYKPSAKLESGDPRSASFSLVDGVTLYGGFAGTETVLEDRDWASSHATTLSGDLGMLDESSDNAYTVVYCGADIEAAVDGVSIVDGNANGSSSSSHRERGNGGGVFNSGTLTVTNSTFAGNSATYDGGGIYNYYGTLTVTNSTLSRNSADDDGGGIYNSAGTLTVANCTLSGNSAGYGGGICNSGGTLTVTNSTLSGNSAGYGGGVYNSGGTLTVTNCTLSGNSAGYGGGIHQGGSSSTATLNNTIVAGNIAPFGPDVHRPYGSISGSHNLIGDGSYQSSLVDGVDGNQVGTSKDSIDPLLSDWTELDDGRWGYYLLPGSPALDAGENALAEDAAGEPLVEDVHGDPRIQNDTVDIGAVEGATAGNSAQVYVVTSLEGTIAQDGVLTFMEAFEAANRNQPVGDALAGSFAEPDAIQFAEGLSGTVSVEDGELVIHGDLNIEGPGAALLTFDAEGTSRVFLVNPDVSADLSGMTITGGSADGGGGIRNLGTLTVTNSTLSENSATGTYAYGGGICTDYGTLTVTNSRLSGNSADYRGGGIYNSGGTLTVANSTFSGNSTGTGGGIYNSGKLTVTNSTLSGNSAKYGGGIRNHGNSSTATLNNTVVAGNAAPSQPDIYLSSGTLSGSHNLIGNGTGQTTFVNGVDGNLVGTAENPIDPLFVRDPSDGGDGWGDNPDTPDIDESANDDYGDLRILHDSPAVDAGDDALLPADEFDLDGDGDTAEAIPYDLAGNPRIAGDRVDMGAYESLGMVYDSVIYVDDDAPAGGDGTAWTSAFSDVQTALDTAALFNTDGDPANDVRAIWIAEGIYRPSAESNPGNPRSARFALVDGVTLYGGFTGTEAALEERALAEEHETVLAGDIGVADDVSDNAYTVVYCGEGIESAIDGVTVTAANGKGGVYNYRGTLRVSKSRLVNNSSSERGGAIHNDGRRGGEATLIVEDSLISENTARDLGGGICSSGYRGSAQLTVLNTTLVENTASFGGAVYSDGESGFAMTTIVGCTISRNEVVPRPSVAPGGGGLLANSASMTIVDSSINENSARAGGGISITGYDATMITISNSVLSGNSASLHGGGIYFNDLSRGQSVLTIDNTTFSGNSSNSKGGAIFISEGELIVTNATVAGNTAQFGSGILAEWHAKAALYNTLVAGNDGGDDIANASLFSGSYNLIGNGTGQTTFIDGQDGNLVGTAENPIDPLFVRAPSDGGDGWGDDPDTPDIDESANDDYGDLRLRSDSPAIDAGDNTLFPADEFDLDGDGDTAEPIPVDLAGSARVVDGDNNGTARVDMGAYEYVAAAVIPGDLNGDGFVGAPDLDIVRASWGQSVTPGSLLDGDPSGDGTVGGADLDIVRANWGRTGPAASVATSASSSAGRDSAEDVVYGPIRKSENASTAYQNLHTLADAAWAQAVTAMRTRTASPHPLAVDRIIVDWDIPS